MKAIETAEPSRPFVTVILPLLNEAGTVESCLEAVRGQDYPHDRLEVLAVDGGSTDGTREIVGRLAARDARIRLLDNPRRLTSAALNVGIRTAAGQVIVRVDGHTRIAHDYVRRCVAALQATGADNVGGLMAPVGTTPFGEAVALALQSRFGVGDARFHYARNAQYVDTVYLGAFRRDVFDRSGLFDESLVRNQDYEMNFRIRAAGSKIYLDPSIHSTYVTRGSPGALWRQYFDYGFSKPRVLRRHPRSVRWRQVVAPAFVAALAAAGLGSVVSRPARLALAVLVGSHAALNLAVSAWNAHRHGWRHLLRLPVVYPAMHLAWGLGFWVSAAKELSGVLTRRVRRCRETSSIDLRS